MDDLKALSIEETAQRLGLCTNTVRNHIKEGRLRAVKIGRRVRIPVSVLRELLEGKAPTEAHENL